MGDNSIEDLGDLISTTTVIPSARKNGRDEKESHVRYRMCGTYAWIDRIVEGRI